jgi:N5-(cytidine 5'-diphosphoramidyl)-L-glutamine hydrolase
MHRPRILISQRVVIDEKTGERRDALDQRWAPFLFRCSVFPVPMPNNPDHVEDYWRETEPAGIILTGGNDLVALGGGCPERDAAECRLIEIALEAQRPILGICRGMQMLQSHFGVPLERVEGHITPRLEISFEGRRIAVNSYHRFGARISAHGLDICGMADDGVIKAVRSKEHHILGIMWHPERETPARAEDVALLQSALGGTP